MPVTPLRKDPVAAFRFWVELDGVLVAGFSQVSGLEIETQFEQYREGGVNNYVHYLPKQTSYQPISLERGLTHSDVLWKWYSACKDGQYTRRNGSIVLCTRDLQEITRWNFFDALPTRWVGPQLSAHSDEIAFESIELVHQGLQAVFSSSVSAT